MDEKEWNERFQEGLFDIATARQCLAENKVVIADRLLDTAWAKLETLRQERPGAAAGNEREGKERT